MASTATSTRRNTSVNALRGLIAVDITLYHFGVQDLTSQAGQMGVCFFLMTSGCFLAAGSGARGGWRNFAKRAARIYPLHWLGLIAMLVLDVALVHKLTYSGSTITLNALLLHSWVPRFDVGYSYNRVSWFLCALVFCYAIAPWLIGLFRRVRLRRLALLLAALSVALAALNLVVGDYWRIYIQLLPPARVLDFAWGVLLGEMLRRGALDGIMSRLTPWRSTLFGVATAAVAVAAVLAGYCFMEPVERTGYVAWWLLPAWLMALCCVCTSGREGMLGRLLKAKPLQWLGDCCFEIYLLEAPIALSLSYCLAPVLGHFGLVLPHSLLLAVTLVVLLAAAVHYVFTKPVTRWLTAKITGEPRRPARQVV